MRRLVVVAVVLIISMPIFNCGGRRPDQLGVKNSQLAACPTSPNCVSSDATDRAHRVDPFELAVPAEDAWRIVRSVVSGMDRMEIIEESDDYLHAESTSALMGYVDDLELHLRPPDESIAIRSASRLGYSDMGVNRKRVEQLRKMLRAEGAIR